MPCKIIMAEVRQMCEYAELDQGSISGGDLFCHSHEWPQFLAKDKCIVRAQNDWPTDPSVCVHVYVFSC